MTPASLKRAVVLVTACSVMTIAAYARTETVPSAAGPASFAWDQSSAALVVSYREVWGEFAEQDLTPMIRIFGDGRILVHYPDYSSKAGDYDGWLQPAELESLLDSLLAKGLASFEPSAVKSLKHSEIVRLQKAALVTRTRPDRFMVADATISVFELKLTAVASGEPQRNIAWSGLETDALLYPDIEPIRQLRAAELELRALLERDDLWRIR